MPIQPCKTFVTDALQRLVVHTGVHNVLNTDCQNAVGDLDLVSILSLGGFNEGITRLLIEAAFVGSPNLAIPLSSMFSGHKRRRFCILYMHNDFKLHSRLQH